MSSIKQKLLVIDGRPGDVDLLQGVLADECEVFFAHTGAAGLELALLQQPDLILAELHLADLNGCEFCRQLKDNPLTKSIPVILTADRDRDEDETRGLEAGAVDYLHKPFKPALLRSRILNHLELKRHRELLENICLMDGLTGVPNRRRFDLYLDQEWRRSQRSNTTLSLLMIDIDYFKQFNDSYGHLAGDECLIKVARTLRETLKRPSDLVARYGGEEFVCILPETHPAGALRVAEELRRNVEGLKIPHLYSKIAPFTTVSVGAACMAPSAGVSCLALVEQADAALYAAKTGGRNRVSGSRGEIGMLPKMVYYSKPSCQA